MHDIDILMKWADEFESTALDINDIRPTRKEDLEFSKERYQQTMSNPETATEYRMQSAERQRQFMERNKELIEAKNKRLAEEARQLKQTGSLEGLLYVLKTQLADKRHDTKRHKPERLEQYNQDAGEIDFLRNKLFEYLVGIPMKAKEASTYNRKHIPTLLKITRSLYQKFYALYGAIGKTLSAIEVKLIELLAL